jgi:hypothetical protein
MTALTAPRDIFVEFVFVHGLRGGPRSTWTFKDDPATFWPLWLPESPQFAHVRIHTYGYNTDWQGRVSTNIDDFGIALLESLATSPQLQTDVSVSTTSNQYLCKS